MDRKGKVSILSMEDITTTATVKKKGPPRGPAGARTFYQVDTKGMCLLCLRECQRTSSKKYKEQVSTPFCKILLRYLKVDFHQNIVKPSKFKWKAKRVKKVGVELCQDCTLLAVSFKDMYCQMELIQMRLNAYVKTISDIMRVAGRIPSRVKAYQARLGIVPKGQGESSTSGTMKPQQITPKSSLLAQTFRKELILRTLESHKGTFPRVKLNRNAKALSAHSAQQLLAKSTGVITQSKKSPVGIIISPLSPIQMQFKNFLIAYTISFSTVWLLTTITGMKFGSIQTILPLNANNVPTLGAIEDMPVSEPSGSLPPPSTNNVLNAKPNGGTSKDTENHPTRPDRALQKDARRNSITITDSGKTVLLPHRSFKTDQEFVDESIMEYEDNADLIDISDDGFFAQANSLISDMSMSVVDSSLPQPETVKQEPQESVIEVNDRTCTECRIHLSCRAELEKHRSLIHKWTNHVQCPVCKNMFSSYHFLKNHRKEVDACAIDEGTEALEFATIAKPLFPYSSTVRGNRFCPMEGCFEVFLKHENLQLHLKAHGLFSCSQGTCKEKFYKAHDLALHESQVHSGGQFSGYKCTRCNFHVGGQYQYMLHFLGEHLNISVFSEQCNICRKGYTSKGSHLVNDKEVHFRTHHDINGKDPKSVIKCDIDNCEAFFVKKQQLRAHKTHIHHVEQEAKLSCSICGVKMLNQSVMMKHKLQAHSNLPGHEIEAEIKRKLYRAPKKGKYNCMYCGNQYSTKYALLIHSKAHDHLKNSAVQEEEEEEAADSQQASVMEAVQSTSTTTDNLQEGKD